MPNLSLGTIEVLGLPAAVEAADVACKTADVTLIGYETTDGMGMVAVKIEGQVSAVKSAVAAAAAAAARVTKVFATSVIARPSDQLEPIVMTKETVGLRKPAPAAAPQAVQPTPQPAQPQATPAPASEGTPAPEPTSAPEPTPAPEAAPAPEPVSHPAALDESPVAASAATAADPEPPVPAEEVTPLPPVTRVEPVDAPAQHVGPVSPKPQTSRRSAPNKPRSAREE
jgi:ethanolamine utilization protein EutM